MCRSLVSLVMPGYPRFRNLVIRVILARNLHRIAHGRRVRRVRRIVAVINVHPSRTIGDIVIPTVGCARTGRAINAPLMPFTVPGWPTMAVTVFSVVVYMSPVVSVWSAPMVTCRSHCRPSRTAGPRADPARSVFDILPSPPPKVPLSQLHSATISRQPIPILLRNASKACSSLNCATKRSRSVAKHHRLGSDSASRPPQAHKPRPTLQDQTPNVKAIG